MGTYLMECPKCNTTIKENNSRLCPQCGGDLSLLQSYLKVREELHRVEDYAAKIGEQLLGTQKKVQRAGATDFRHYGEG